MARSRLSQADVVQVMRLLADVASLKGDPRQQQQLFIDRLVALVGADVAFVYRGDDWRVNRTARFSQATFLSGCDSFFLRYITEFGVTHPVEADPFCLQSMRSNLPVQTWRLGRVLIDLESTDKHSGFRDLARTVGVHDGMISLYRSDTNKDSIIGVALHRLGKNRAFTDRQTALVKFAIKELREMAGRGYISLDNHNAADVPLPPRLQEMLKLLLQGHSAKQIARITSLSVWTVREHVSRLYERLSVNGRQELMARFIPAQR